MKKQTSTPPPWHFFRVLISLSLAAALTGCIIEEVEPEPSPSPEPAPTAAPEPTPDPTPDAPPEVLAAMDALGAGCTMQTAQNIVDAFAAVGVTDLDDLQGDGGDPIMTVSVDYGGNTLYAEMGQYHGPVEPDPDDPDWDEDISPDVDPDWYANTDWTAVNDIYSGDVRLYENGAPVAQVQDVLLTRDQAICLYVCLEDDVTPYLYFPDTARFPAFSMDDGTFTATIDGPGQYSVRSYVDAGNALGEIVSTWYTAHYSWDGVPGSVPVCTGIEIEE